MKQHIGKRFPQPGPETLPYWEACRAHRLRIQRCEDCGNFQFYPRIICITCSGEKLSWVDAGGTGEIVSYTIITRAVSEAYKADVPYVVALIKLQEGPTMMSNVVDCDVNKVATGMQVTVVFEDWSDEISIPKFRPLKIDNTL